MQHEPGFLERLTPVIEAYLAQTAEPGEHLSLLRWQMAERHRLESRETYPGHLTTSAIIVSPDLGSTLLIDHLTLKRWLQPGGHYEPAEQFWHSARREAEEETGLAALVLHPWHGGGDKPFVIDSHDVPGKAARGERPHIHHDLQFVFVADRHAPLAAQLDEVAAARWHPIGALAEVSPRAFRRLDRLSA
ncbi:NUDIX domain-containing protein [Rhabdaerophilum sp. SD176]|uniref:NUDIX hydrolase n=1 Tax=Rhabdaerophilum sp. SD176 TaxID=2983548 RepID=UPI0024DF56A3|nr:NUDIX domain-containing protein [Rhabdaerophilum sp. SD176]